MADDNKLLGQFVLPGIPPAPRGVPQIEVAFDIDSNGIVNVGASDKATGKEQQITIQSSGGLSDEEISQMVRDAESNQEKDRQRKDLVEAKNGAESVAFETEKALNDNKDALTAEDVARLEAEIKSFKETMESAQAAQQIKDATNTLQQSSLKLFEIAYRKKAGMNETSTPQEEATPEPEAAEAETSE
eukprot:TRINITY_DN25900_c0_g1_i1.p1 TRINITY_DN25900_c0_g1~~TRINITY_DN25900_c0_g1_i1.p1  ORF type:complete len:215 (-),score=111.34 TRINITY_DN25900_c0_g1_i1:83-646(-)